MNHIGLHLAKAKAMGKPLEVAVAKLCDPAIHVAACTGTPFGAWTSMQVCRGAARLTGRTGEVRHRGP